MSIRIPAVAAAALFASLIGTSAANAASARINPVIDNGRTGYVTATLINNSEDACAMTYNYVVLGGDANGQPTAIYSSRRFSINACRPGYGTLYEDGSATTRIGGAFLDTSTLESGGKFAFAINLFSHRRYGGAPWVRHTFVRTFWHTRSLPTVQVPDCRLGPC